MNNADMPASPMLKGWKSDSRGKAANTGFEVTNYTGGLTKREKIAAKAMQGMLSNPDWPTPDTISEDAVFAADALLTELEKDQ